MANRLTMATISAIDTLRKTGRSRRQVAELLGLHRETVGKYFDRLGNQPHAPTGSGGPPTGRDPPAPAVVTPGPASACEPFRDLIGARLQQGLTAQRIYQDLVTDHGFTAKYHSVRRFVRKLLQRTELPVRRLEVAPGEQAQIDFGSGAPVRTPDGKAEAKTHLTDDVYIAAYRQCQSLREAAALLTRETHQEVSKDQVQRAIARAGGVGSVLNATDSDATAAPQVFEQLTKKHHPRLQVVWAS